MSNEEIIGILKSIQDHLKRIEDRIAALEPRPIIDRPETKGED